MNRKRWTEEEKQAFYNILRGNTLAKTVELHALNTGRSLNSVYRWYFRTKAKNLIPEDVEINLQHRRLWNEDEIKTLLQLVAEHPNNFKEAFRIHANNTGRNINSVQAFFHRYRKQEEAKVCMLIIGEKKKCSPNRKNIYAGTGGSVTPVKKSWWKKLIGILFE